MDQLVLLDGENTAEDVQKNNIVEDTEFFQELKKTSQKFLEVNNFDIGSEPNFKTYSNNKFVKYIEKKSREQNPILETMKKVKISIDFRSSMSNVYAHKNFPNHKILIFFQPQTKTKGAKIGIDVIKNFIGLLLLLDCTEGVFISSKLLSPRALDQINDSNTGGEENIYNITNYTDNEFIDITEHIFVPKVLEILRTKESIEEFSESENINISVLPRMLNSDKLVKFYRGKPGNIFKLERRVTTGNLMIQTQIVYRRVV